jgi:hypothetical protein
MTAKRLIRLTAILATLALLAPGVGRADPKGGGGIAVIQCNITLIMFPNNVPFPGVGPVVVPQCVGGANGGGVSLTSTKKPSLVPPLAPAVWTATSTWNVATKTGATNFEVYNLQYGEDCSVLKGFPVFPPIGIAMGHAAIDVTGTNLPPATDFGTIKAAYVHTKFLYLRIGGWFVAALIDPHMHNGAWPGKAHKTSKPGGVGIGAGQFIPKMPFSDCASKGFQTIGIVGVFVFLNNVV